MNRLSVLALLLVAPALSLAEDANLCPPAEPLPGVPDDFRMSEADFTQSRFAKAMSYFETELPQILRDVDNLPAVIDSSQFWIIYENNAKHLKGYALRQAALREHSAGVPTADGTAVSQFCEFVSQARFTD